MKIILKITIILLYINKTFNSYIITVFTIPFPYCCIAFKASMASPKSLNVSAMM